MSKIKRLAVLLAGFAAAGGGQDAPQDVVVRTPEAGAYDEPSYSPDGTRLAFTRRNGGDDGLWVADMDGGNAMRLSPPAGNVWAISWSPDSRAIAFASATGGPPSIWTSPVGGGEAARLLDWVAWGQRYSPDGSQCAILAFKDTRTGVWLMPTAGGEPTPMTTDLTEWGTPIRWSPDGTRVAMAMFVGAGQVVSVKIIDLPLTQ